jgi:hypothetical protein
MNKQTAVEWLEKKISDLVSEYVLKNLFEQAKEMEKEQIIESNYDGQSLHAKSVTSLMMKDNAEQYYNELYNK